jgi:hypothetical protein
MIDLILIKITEHALRAVYKPTLQKTFIITQDGCRDMVINSYPSYIHKHERGYVFYFPPNTKLFNHHHIEAAHTTVNIQYYYA